MRRKRDANQREIEKAYAACGCSVFDASAVGRGFPDLVVGIAGHTCLVEVKSRSGRNKIEESQRQFMAEWRGGNVMVVRDVGDVERHVRMMRKQ